ncbi:hypothetical protein HAZT_HAZT010899 [Hyalella azteca]|uniref:Phospholipid/glycerol acyltransferase domain-containing protein n=1 Tax=Hyalella azteca TaxID=294128 RepID=A0A6A0HBR9_HYAAZ|nr:hypothetical protein HAZT_HAZT010899 [Hyalella azteca]
MVRYFILLPIRVAILFVGTIYLVLGCAVIGQMPDGRIKRWLANCMFLSMFRIMARGFSNVVYYHNTHNRPRSDGICVANHTSPIDCIVLAQDGCFSFVSLFHI